ncbi:hypothetical protein HMPREF6745_0074 [Prevotella sp. oral taxon 472 str. F0295]|nr:hypothetical protein [Prevotella sp. oral taxon 472]EEX54486.1 hypothetical protein HMPREF6745_0074 [Prevotella sp. oral taxon 472 str. F0295]
MNKNDILYSNIIRGLQGKQPSLGHQDDMINGVMARIKQRFVALHDTLLREYSRETDLTAIYMYKSKWFKNFFHSDVYSEILDNDTLMREVSTTQRDFLALSMFKIDCQLILPHLDNSPLSSKLTGNMLMANDVVISCYVSLPNLWSFALLGLILVVSLVLLVLMRKKR